MPRVETRAERDDALAVATRAGTRPGMPVTIDPTPFILLGDAAPSVARGLDGRQVVTRVDEVRIGGEPHVRLWLGHDAFLQVHGTAASGRDSRLFTLVDRVTPGDAEEWGFWLDADGAIGAREFKARDERTFARVWSPDAGENVPPVAVSGRGDDGSGVATRVSGKAMLYARPTGAEEPAPKWEYALVETDEGGTGSSVGIWGGVDVAQASLEMAA